MMKKIMMFTIVLCLLLAGCTQTKQSDAAESEVPEPSTVETEAEQDASGSAEQESPTARIQPLPDTTMESWTDAILSVSLKEGDAYVDDTGKMQMDLKIYTYDKYDMVDISLLKAGDIIVTHAGEVEVTSVERSENGAVYINGGLEAGGFDLVTDDSGIFYETGFNDAKNWYEVGTATIRVSADFEGCDQSDPEQGDVILYPGDFLVGAISNYDFTPHNTTIRVEEGQIIEMTRRYVP